MRICILCEEEKVSQAREKMKNDRILTVPCSTTGELPSTHRFCCLAVTEHKANEMLTTAEITTMEISGPKEFLDKHNLKMIK